MAKTSIPDEIKQYRPGPCTEVKLIGGHYYVYMYQSVQLASGKWGKKTGKSIGTIIPGTGFVIGLFAIYRAQKKYNGSVLG